MAFYGEKKIRVITNVFRSLLITAVPAVSMTVLFLIKRMALRLAFVVVFAGLFTVLIAIFTQSKTVELFVLTTA